MLCAGKENSSSPDKLFLLLQQMTSQMKHLIVFFQPWWAPVSSVRCCLCISIPKWGPFSQWKSTLGVHPESHPCYIPLGHTWPTNWAPKLGQNVNSNSETNWRYWNLSRIDFQSSLQIIPGEAVRNFEWKWLMCWTHIMVLFSPPEICKSSSCMIIKNS